MPYRVTSCKKKMRLTHAAKRVWVGEILEECMNDEEIWKMRGIYAQICSAEQDVVFILADRRFNPSRKRDLIRRLEHIVEQIKGDVA